jgi:hypothetical protein
MGDVTTIPAAPKVLGSAADARTVATKSRTWSPAVPPTTSKEYVSDPIASNDATPAAEPARDTKQTNGAGVHEPIEMTGHDLRSNSK